jgi:hypothetical protein
VSEGFSPALPFLGRATAGRNKIIVIHSSVKRVIMKKVRRKLFFEGKSFKMLALSVQMLLLATALNAQDGNAGIQEANTKVRSYFASGTDLMYAVGAIVGLIGAVKVYQKWNSGDHDTGKVAAAWFGSCVFLVVVATVIKSFFGV